MRPLIVLTLLISLGCGSPEEYSRDTALTDYSEPASEAVLRETPIPERRERFADRSDDPVSYYNPRTGHTADYTLDVEYNSDGTVARINFPNGGWIDEYDFDQSDNGDGTITIDHEGREFTVPTRGRDALSVDPGDDIDREVNPQRQIEEELDAQPRL